MGTQASKREIRQAILDALTEGLEIEETDEPGEYLATLPLTYRDGNPIAIIAHIEGSEIIFSDDGNTVMNLAGGAELENEKIAYKIRRIIQAYNIEWDGEELSVRAPRVRAATNLRRLLAAINAIEFLGLTGHTVH